MDTGHENLPPMLVTDHTFDIVIGMAVYGPDETKIGTVTEVSGFGSTLLRPTTGIEAGESVIQARSGTGYIKVKRDQGGTIATVPFHDIASVVPGERVTIQSTPSSEPTRPLNPVATVAAKKPGFLSRLFGNKGK
jgi:hypothetical protein